MYVGRNKKSTILEQAIKKNTAVKEFLDAGAQIINTNKNRTAFHCIASKTSPKKSIETILTHARPAKIKDDEKEAYRRWIVRGLIWAFIYDKGPSNLSILPLDIKRRILSHFDEECFNNSNGALYKIVFPFNYVEEYFVGKTKERVIWLIEILQKQNRNGKTASQNILENNNLPENYKNEILTLVNSAQIENDYKKFIENPNVINQEEKTLVHKIYDNIRTEWSQDSNNLD